MRIFSGMMLALTIGVAFGCGGKSDSPPADPKAEPTPTAGGTTAPVNPNSKPVIPAAVPATWEMDPAKHTIPTGPVTGKVRGESVELSAQAEKDAIRFLINKAGLGTAVVEIHLSDPEKSTERLSLSVKPDGTGLDVPNVIVWNPVKPDDAPQVIKSGFALTLNLGKREKGKLAGKVYLSLSDEQKSFFAGSFEADWIRPVTEVPGADDAPYIQGKLSVTGAADANVWYGVLRVEPHDPTKPTLINVHGTELKAGASPIRADTLRPLSLIVPGANGLKDPARYEVTKLEPGRYWVFATVKGGPMAWKWVDVTPTSQVAIDFAIDAANIGSLDVTAPGTAESVAVLPAPEPGKAWPESVISSAASIVDLYASNKPDAAKTWTLGFPRLAPGKYEVWSGDQKVDVEIKAKETAKVEFKKK